MTEKKSTGESGERWRWAAVIGLVVVAAIVGWVLVDGESSEPTEDDAEVRSGEPSAEARANPLKAAQAFYESRPYYQQPMPYTEVPEGLPDLKAETCGSCHQEIYEEWKLSTHRRAWKDDPQFQAELAKSRGAHSDAENPDDVGWMCVTCHTPMVNQMPRLVVGLEDGDIGQPIYVDNPTFEPELQDDAITCATCHVRDGVVYGPYGDTQAPHPTAKDEKLRTEETCTQCHQAQAEWPSRNLACFFTTGEEWASSKYAEQGKTCQGCHMPAVERRLAGAFKDRPKRKTRRHWFGGSLIPKKPEHADGLEPLQEVYGSGADIGLAKGEAEEPPSDGLKVEKACESDGECVRLKVRVTNAHAGHELPTGDPERHIDVTATARNADGDVLAEVRQRVGSKYVWWPEIKKKYDTRIAPGETLEFDLKVPAGDEAFDVEIVAEKYRMYRDAFEHHDLEGKYVRGRTFHTSRWSVDASGAVELKDLDNDKKD